MASALEDLKLDRLFVVCPGATRYALSERSEALSLEDRVSVLRKIR